MLRHIVPHRESTMTHQFGLPVEYVYARVNLVYVYHTDREIERPRVDTGAVDEGEGVVEMHVKIIRRRGIARVHLYRMKNIKYRVWKRFY